jgi:hypothetical protein
VNITNDKIVLGIIIILFSIFFIISCIAEKDINRYTNILIKEIIIFFPIGLLMLAYPIYKSVQWGFSPDMMYGFTPVLINLLSIFIILMDKLVGKFLKDRGYYSSDTRSKYVGALSFCIVLTPVVTIASLIGMIFGIK